MNQFINTVLVVDDEDYVRQSFADYFEDCLWRTLQSESGEKALKLFEQEIPDAVIVDIRMGGMDGNDFIREANRKGVNIPFVVCTGSPEYDIPQDLLDMPYVSNLIFKKPLNDMAEIERELTRLMEKRNKDLGIDNCVR